MRDLPAETLTFLFTDIEGSTRLWEQFPGAMQQALIRHNALIHACVTAYDGQMVRERGEGDSTFSVFVNARQALAAAVCIQKRVQEHDWPIEAPIRVRIALHTGKGELQDGDYHSVDVNRCARLRDLGHGDQTLLSRATYVAIGERLPADVTFKDLGTHRLKDLQEPEQVYQVSHVDLPSDFPPLRSQVPTPTQGKSWIRTGILLALVGSLITLALRPWLFPARALTTLYAFGSPHGFGRDGANPRRSQLIENPRNPGIFYGTTSSGGINDTGTVFQLSAGGNVSILYSFAAMPKGPYTPNKDGSNPVCSLTWGRDGDLYGATSQGGIGGTGTLYKITPDGRLSTFYQFTALRGGVNTDGARPLIPLLLASNGNFYGATNGGGPSTRIGEDGGNENGTGTIFQITPAGKLTRLFAFSIPTGRYPYEVNRNGLYQIGQLVEDKRQPLIFYGTTFSGGANGAGIVFRFFRDAVTSVWKLTPIHGFDAVVHGTNMQGTHPAGGVIQGSDENLYGVTADGGPGGAGTVFKVSPDGTGFAVLHTFSALNPDGINPDGAHPNVALIEDRKYPGTFYGCTLSGGSGGTGVIFRISSNGARFDVLYAFSPLRDKFNSDGAGPESPLTQGHDGKLYGTASSGGPYGAGTVFCLQIPPEK